MARAVQSSSLGVDVPVWQRSEYQLQALVVLAVLFGGGGSAYGVCNLVVQIAALLILAFNPDKVVAFFAHAPRLFVALCTITFFFPLIQLVPLPPFLWAQLPGRDLLGESLALIGRSSEWYPLSLAPARTFTAFLSMLPVLAILAISWNFKNDEWERTLRLVIVLALAVLALGGLQLLSANGMLVFYPHERVSPGMLYGTFANHNTSGLFFVLALVALMAEGAMSSGDRSRHLAFSWSQSWGRGGVAVLLTTAVILTQSRSSMATLFVVLVCAAVYLMSAARLQNWKMAALLLLGGAMCAAALFALQSSTRFGSSFERFDNLDNVRPAIWEDTISSARRFWPAGSGISSFPEVFEVDETLEHVWGFHAGRAHNDYLEIAQEAGLVGLVLIAAWLLWVAWTLYLAKGAVRRQQTFAAGCGIGVIALQSAIDYPLRNQIILCVGGLFISLLANNMSAGRLSRGE